MWPPQTFQVQYLRRRHSSLFGHVVRLDDHTTPAHRALKQAAAVRSCFCPCNISRRDVLAGPVSLGCSRLVITPHDISAKWSKTSTRWALAFLQSTTAVSVDFAIQTIKYIHVHDVGIVIHACLPS